MEKTIKEMIEVMEAYAKGAIIEYNDSNCPFWEAVTYPSWDWSRYDYRVKEVKETIVIEKWLIALDDIKVVIEASDIDAWLKPFSTAQKIKLIEITYY